MQKSFGFKKVEKSAKNGHFGCSIYSKLIEGILQKFLKKCELTQRTFSQNFESKYPIENLGTEKKPSKNTNSQDLKLPCLNTK